MGCSEELLFDLVEGEVHREVRICDGCLSYAVASCRCARSLGTIVLIHGVGSNASRWEEFTEQTPLRDDWRIIRLDLRGHGASESSEKATLEVHAADLIRVLDDAAVEKAVLVGHSLGAQIAMRAAFLYPGRICGMVLVDPLITGTLTPAALGHRKKYPLLIIVEYLARLLNKVGIRRRMPRYSLRAHDLKAREMLAMGGDSLRAFVDEYSSPLKDLEHIHTACYMRDILEVGRVTPELSEIEIPILVIGSSSGTFTDAGRMQEWVRGLRKGTWAVVNCFHWPLTECPREVSCVIENWICDKFGR